MHTAQSKTASCLYSQVHAALNEQRRNDRKWKSLKSVKCNLKIRNSPIYSNSNTLRLRQQQLTRLADQRGQKFDQCRPVYLRLLFIHNFGIQFIVHTRFTYVDFGSLLIILLSLAVKTLLTTDNNYSRLRSRSISISIFPSEACKHNIRIQYHFVHTKFTLGYLCYIVFGCVEQSLLSMRANVALHVTSRVNINVLVT